MKKFMKLQLLALMCALGPLTGLTATEVYPENVSPEQVQEKIASKAARARQEYHAYESGLGVNSSTRSKSKTNKGIIDVSLSAAVDYQTTSTKAWHFATAVSPKGSHVFLEDGSGWNVCRSDAYKTLDWYGSDVIALTLAPWFSFYDYVLVNGRTGAKVYVELNEVPEGANAYTLWITNIDPYTGRITLSDRTVWEISSFEFSTVADWEVAQKVIIGVNNRGFFSPQYNFLLNQDAREYVKADCLY